jgi:hypothetical protein
VSGNFELRLNGLGQLSLHRPGVEPINDVRLRRAFPWSDPNHYISIRTSDGKELELLQDLSSLTHEQADLIKSWLNENRFVPKITRIKKLSLDFGHQEWEVDTDRGPRSFRVQEREDIRFLHDGRFSVKDADGNVYELAGLEKLDEASRKLVESLL